MRSLVTCNVPNLTLWEIGLNLGIALKKRDQRQAHFYEMPVYHFVSALRGVVGSTWLAANGGMSSSSSGDLDFLLHGLISLVFPVTGVPLPATCFNDDDVISFNWKYTDERKSISWK